MIWVQNDDKVYVTMPWIEGWGWWGEGGKSGWMKYFPLFASECHWMLYQKSFGCWTFKFTIPTSRKTKTLFGKVQKHNSKWYIIFLDPMLDWAENLGKNRKGHIDWMVRFSTSMMIGSTTPQFPKQQMIWMTTTRPKLI